jgi:hypothetical protein
MEIYTVHRWDFDDNHSLILATTDREKALVVWRVFKSEIPSKWVIVKKWLTDGSSEFIKDANSE